MTAKLLTPVVKEAIARWRAVGLSAAKQKALARTRFQIKDLGYNLLGQTTLGSTLVTLDGDAAGIGWFVDTTLTKDEEFRISSAGAKVAGANSAAYGKIDLLTAVMHEMGHVLGAPDLAAALAGGRLMAGQLATGVRKVPTAADLHDAVIAGWTAATPSKKAKAKQESSLAVLQ